MKKNTTAKKHPKALSNRKKNQIRQMAAKPYFQGMQPGTEKCVVFFPRTPIARDQEFNRVIDVRVVPGSITVIVVEGIPYSAPSVIYDFDYSFRVVNVMLSKELQMQYALLQKSGELPRESPEIIEERLKGQVKVIQPDTARGRQSVLTLPRTFPPWSTSLRLNAIPSDTNIGNFLSP